MAFDRWRIGMDMAPDVLRALALSRLVAVSFTHGAGCTGRSLPYGGHRRGAAPLASTASPALVCAALPDWATGHPDAPAESAGGAGLGLVP